MTSHVTGHLTVAEAVTVTGASESTIRRRLRENAFPGAIRETGGGWRVPREDLVAAGLLTGSTGAEEAVEMPVVDVREDVVDVALVERAVRAEVEAQEATRLREEVATLRARDERRSKEVEELREAKGRAEATVEELRRVATATGEAHAVEVERLLHVVDRLTRRLDAAPEDEAPRVVIAHEVTGPGPVEDVADEDLDEAVDANAGEEAVAVPIDEPPAAPVVDEPVERHGAWSAVRGWLRRR